MRRRLWIVALVLGLVVGIAGPFSWHSAAPVWIGAALLALAGALAGRAPLVVAGAVGAVVLVLAPGLVNGYRNGQGVAWTVPEGERLELAQDGLAVTTVEDEPVLRGRDLRTGERRWELRLRDTGEQPRLWRIGALVLTTGFDETLRAVGADDGKVRWASPGAVTFLGVSDGEHVAATRCGRTSATCEVQSLALRDGSVAWRAPVSGVANYLGVPLPDEGAPQRDLPPWPAGFVLVTDNQRWEARDLATGRVLTTGQRADAATALLGDVLVRSAEDGALTATDVRSGEAGWTRPAGDGRASISPVVTQRTLAVPEGSLVLSGDGWAIDSVRLGERLRTVDVRTGKLTESRLDTGYGLVDVLAAERPTGARPVVLARDYEDDARPSTIVAGRHVFQREDVRDVQVAPDLIGFEGDGPTWGTGLGRVIEVFDRDSGARRVRFAADDTNVYRYGDALVVSTGADDERVQRVVAP